MSLKTILQGIGKVFQRGKKVAATPATGKEQKLLTYSKEAQEKTAKELAKQEVNLPAVPLKKTQPLHMGDKSPPVFGSSTYDWAMKKGQGKFSADEWIDHLAPTRQIKIKMWGKPATRTIRDTKKFTYDSGPFAGKEATISKEELFDSNLAIFNEAGDLTGGLLYAAKKFGLKLDANEIGAMIKLNPINRLQAVELGTPSNAKKLLNQFSIKAKSELDTLERRLGERNLPAIQSEITNAKYELRGMTRSSLEPNQVEQSSKAMLDSLNKIKKSQNLLPEEKVKINKLISEIEDVSKPFSKKGTATRYGNESAYTLQGGDNYSETVWRLNEPIPSNTKPVKTFGHFDGVNENMVYHVRYDTRYTPDGKKVFMIHEVQSDANQSVAKALNKFEQLGGERRVNPFQADIEMNLLTNERSKLLKQMDEAIAANQPNKANAIAADLKNINNKIKNTFAAKNQYDDRYFDYFPMVEADAYGDHAVKYLMNKAAREGVDYVAIAPFNKLSLRQGYKEGNERFYGYATGKGIGNKGEAVLPKVMKRIARFYDSKAGPTKLSLSNPNQPYKKIKTETLSAKDGKKIKNTYHTESRVKEDIPEGNLDQYQFMEPSDPNLYFDAFAIKVSPLMKQTVKTYKAEGGLVVDIFKPIRYNEAWQ